MKVTSGTKIKPPKDDMHKIGLKKDKKLQEFDKVLQQQSQQKITEKQYHPEQVSNNQVSNNKDIGTMQKGTDKCMLQKEGYGSFDGRKIYEQKGTDKYMLQKEVCGSFDGRKIYEQKKTDKYMLQKEGCGSFDGRKIYEQKKPDKYILQKEQKYDDEHIAFKVSPGITMPPVHAAVSSPETTAQIGITSKNAPVLPQHVIDSIVENVRVGINAAGNTEFQVDLKSSVLEGLKLRVSTDEGRIMVSFIAEAADVKEMITVNRTKLEEILRDKGLDVAEINVTDRETSSSAAQHGMQDNTSQEADKPIYDTLESTLENDVDNATLPQSKTDYIV